MNVTGLGWLGTRTNRGEDLARFYGEVLGLQQVHAEPGFWVFRLPGGQHVEVFGTEHPDKEHFTTGPVVGFGVEDLAAAVQELAEAGVELIGDTRWSSQHFRGPDGNIYELVATPAEEAGAPGLPDPARGS